MASSRELASSSEHPPIIERNAQVFHKPVANKKKFIKDTHQPVVMAERPCFKGGRLNEWVVAPSKMVDGIMMCRIATKEHWLTMMLAGRVVSGEMNGAVDRMKLLVKSKLADAANAMNAKKEEDEETRMAAAMAGRAALGLDDDSDFETDISDCVQASTPNPKRRRSMKGPTVHSTGVHQIEIQGISMHACVLARVLWVECTAEIIEAIIKEAKAQLLPNVVREARKRQAERLSREVTKPEDRSRVCYSHAKRCFLVTYTDSNGVKRQCRKGLQIPCADTRGRSLKADAHKEVMQKMRLQAHQLWNKLDMSMAPRYELTKK